MPDPVLEREHLAIAERHITQGEGRVTAQMLRIEELRGAGHDVKEAEKFLTLLEATLSAWQEHRDEIFRDLARHRPRHLS
jgi:hypothetical protein